MKTYYLFGENIAEAFKEIGFSADFIFNFIIDDKPCYELHCHDNEQDENGYLLLKTLHTHKEYAELEHYHYLAFWGAKITTDPDFKGDFEYFMKAMEMIKVLNNYQGALEVSKAFLMCAIIFLDGSFHPDNDPSEYINERKNEIFIGNNEHYFKMMIAYSFSVFKYNEEDIYDYCNDFHREFYF